MHTMRREPGHGLSVSVLRWMPRRSVLDDPRKLDVEHEQRIGFYCAGSVLAVSERGVQIGDDLSTDVHVEHGLGEAGDQSRKGELGSV